jgi:hypothetical protein
VSTNSSSTNSSSGGSLYKLSSGLYPGCASVHQHLVEQQQRWLCRLTRFCLSTAVEAAAAVLSAVCSKFELRGLKAVDCEVL